MLPAWNTCGDPATQRTANIAECPKCERERVFKKYATKQGRQSWTCTGCGRHIHPTAGTIFAKSSTSLHLWYYALYLMASTRCGISAKQLERELGVSYRTAWRMFNKIRNQLMADDGEPLSGDVEIDETSTEGRPRHKFNRQEAARYRERSRQTVIGMVERGGNVRLRVIASRRGVPLRSAVRANVDPSALVFTDDWPAYNFVGREFLGHSRDQPLGGDLRRWRQPHEHNRRLLRQPQNGHAGLRTSMSRPAGCSPTWTNTPTATTADTTRERCSRDF